MTDSFRAPADRPIVLVGFMGAGKSRIGRLLAERLNLPFADSDSEIAREAGMSIADIFREHGEAAFRSAERRVIAALLANGRQVIAVGGGAFVDPDARRLIKESATTIWLDPAFDLIAERVSRSAERPLAAARSRDELQHLWEQRRPSYAEAHFRIETSDDDPERAVDRIIARLAA